MAEFGEQLKKAREAKGITQQALAEKVYVTRQAVSRWERGERYPDILTTKKLAQILEVSMDELLADGELKEIAEKNPIIEAEKPILNNLMIALYAVTSATFLLTVVFEMVQLHILSVTTGVESPMTLASMLEIAVQGVVFLYGLVAALKENLSPKKSGAIAILYFLSGCIKITHYIYIFIVARVRLESAFPFHILPYILQMALPCIVGTVASYFYFCRAKYSKVAGWVIVILSGWKIITMLGDMVIQINQARHLESMGVEAVSHYISGYSLARLILKVCIYLLLIYQVYVLNRKRKLARAAFLNGV